MASRSLKNDQHADAGNPKEQNAKAQAETPAYHPTSKTGNPRVISHKEPCDD